MHILQINTEKGWRGGERQTLFIAGALRDAGVKVSLLCRKGYPLYKNARAAGISPVGVKNEFSALIHIISQSKRYTLLHAQTARGYNTALFGTWFSHVPVMCSRRVLFAPHGRWGRWKYCRAAAVAAVSGAVRAVLENAGCTNVTVISDMYKSSGTDANRCAEFTERYQLEGKRVVGVVAALTSEKGPLTMVQAAKQVCEKKADVRFLHFGSGPLMERIKSLCRRYDLDGKYLLPGFEPSVESLFGMFDVFAMSSVKEGLGSSVLDAFYHRVPVAVTSAGGLAELVDGRGLLCPPGDADGLAQNIITLLSDTRLRQKYTKDAFSYLKENHSSEVITGKTIALYRGILG